MKSISTIALFLMFNLTSAVPITANAETASATKPDYYSFKGGYYYPSERLNLSEFSGTDFNRRKGFNAEAAVGHYYSPLFGTELGIGYFENERFPGSGPGKTRIQAVPLLLSARLYLPMGPVEPYGELGVGAYFSKLEIETPIGATVSFREVDFGTHAGVGININFSDAFFLGIEGRFRKIEPEFDSRELKMDGYTATLNLGFRY